MMIRYWAVAAATLAVFLAVFAAFEWAGPELLHDPIPWLDDGGWGAAALGVGLLAVDVIVPVPSSAVMVAHGALFGVWLGTLLSLVGSVGATTAGFALGRAGGPWLARMAPPEQRERADRLLQRWGSLAILATRPVPLLAETVAVLAGASPLGWRRAMIAALAGSLPPALIYAVAGATVGGVAGTAVVFAAVLLLAVASWALERRAGQRAMQTPPPRTRDSATPSVGLRSE